MTRQHSTRQGKLQLYARSSRDTGLWLLLIATGVIVSTGFALRGEHWLVPDRGAGYALGVVGLGCMTALLGYSLRKRLRGARRWGPISTWFRVHMFLGLAGPVAILLHCNFSLGSVNATVALLCALAVSASGVVGRMLYGRIHAGLFGRKLTLLDLRGALAERRRALEKDAGSGGTLELPRVERFEREALAPRGLLRGGLRLATLPLRRRWVERDAARVASGLAADARKAIARDLAAYLDALQGVATFLACERLFSLWHAVHLPLCVVLFGAAVIHVVAVHVY